MKGMPLNFKQFSLTLIAVSTIALSSAAHAVGIVAVGLGLNNENPADMSIVSHYEATFDLLSYDLNFQTKNFTINGVPGSAVSGHTNELPFFHLAYRLSPKWVVGVNYSHPLWLTMDYGANSFINSQSVDLTLHSVDINPRISYQFSPNFAVGVGFDALELTGGSLYNQIPSGGPMFNFIDNGSSWAYGWDAGVFAALSKATFASFVVYSQISSTLMGQSSYNAFGRVLANNNTRVRVELPPVFLLRLTQFLSKTWLVQLLAAYEQTNVYQELNFQNTALGAVTIPQYNNNTFMLTLLARHQFNQYWAFLLGGGFEDGSQPTLTNRPALPIGDQWSLFAGPSLNLNKIASAQLVYAHVWAHSNYNYVSNTVTANPGVFVPVLGGNHTNANVIDFRLTFKA